MKKNELVRVASVVAACALVCVSASAQERVEQVEAQVAPEGVERGEGQRASSGRAAILECAAAINRARSIRWDISHRKEGNLPVPLGGASARVTMLKPESTKYHWIMRAKGTGNMRGGDPLVPFDVAWFIDQTQFVDSAAGGVVVRKGRVMDAGVRLAETVRVKEMIGTNPWRDEMEKADSVISGEETLDGVVCTVVDITYRANQRQARMWIGKEDKLPRRFAQYVGGGNEAMQFSASFITDFRNVELNPSLTMEDVEIEGPEGGVRERFVITTDPVDQPVRAATLARLGGDGGEEGAERVEQRRQPAREIRPMATGFSLRSAEGEIVSLDSLRGSVVVLDFMGSWSIQCRQSAPEVQALHERFKDRGVRVLGMSVRERSDDRPIAFFKDRGLGYTLLLGADGVASSYDVRTYPTFVVIGRGGELLGKFEKYVAGETIEQVSAMVERELGGEVVTPPGG
ncbi:MAG: redoxin domain-containing protein [Phycisphaeraceae bacterium]|nr:MAG: redoxin domain-containing protein [Phycisphaeraceae bacterium]